MHFFMLYFIEDVGYNKTINKRVIERIPMHNTYYQQEIQEALNAGREALHCLDRAKECLSSAGNWGLLDILGGDFITTFVKHSKMNNANEEIQKARLAIQKFQRELMDVENIPEFQIKTGDFLSFADYFFDNFITDLMVQSRIKEAKKQVEDARHRVQYIMAQLEAM